jgi:hypothetical protein
MEKKSEIQIRNLLEGNDSDVMRAIDLIREKENIASIPLLCQVFIKNPSSVVAEEIFHLLISLKNPACSGHLAQAAIDCPSGSKKRDLVSACWQNGLTYTGYFDGFLKILAFEELETAVEAFSVIDTSLEEMDESEYKNALEQIEEMIPKSEGENQKLLETFLQSRD